LTSGKNKFVRQRKRAGDTKLFAKVGMGRHRLSFDDLLAGLRRFIAKAGAAAPKTCFHRFRHGFRDALREARLDRDIALALSGWTAGNGPTAGRTPMATATRSPR
jgi:integrase